MPQRKGEPLRFSRDEHPRSTSLEALAKLRGVVRADGNVTAGNASGVNDGACALLLASEQAMSANDLQPLARVVGVATAGWRRGLWASARRRRCVRCWRKPG